MTDKLSRRALLSLTGVSLAGGITQAQQSAPSSASGYVVKSQPLFVSGDAPVVLRDHLFDGQGECAVDLRWPLRGSHHWPTAVLDNVVVQGQGWRNGVRLANAWNAKLQNVTVQGPIVQNFLQPEMGIGIDCGTSMDVHITNPNIVHASVGVQVIDPDQNGHAEGFHLTDGWLQHTITGIKLLGLGSGGWPTTCAVVRGPHIAYLMHGMWVENYSGLIISEANLYASPQLPDHIGIYLKNCWHVTINACHFWRNQPNAAGTAIYLDGCHNVVIQGCTAANTLARHVLCLNGCTNVRLGANGFIPERVQL
jgi:hypothetical protein